MLDACILITFGNAGALEIITGLLRHPVMTTSRSVREVTKQPATSAVHDAVSDGTLQVTAIDLNNRVEQENLRRFDSLTAFRGRADAEVLALAVSRGNLVCSDRTAAIAEIGAARVAGSLDLLVWSVKEKRLSPTGAEALFYNLDVAPGITARLEDRGQKIVDLLKN